MISNDQLVCTSTLYPMFHTPHFIHTTIHGREDKSTRVRKSGLIRNYARPLCTGNSWAGCECLPPVTLPQRVLTPLSSLESHAPSHLYLISQVQE